MSILVVGSVAFDSIRTPFGEVENAQGGSALYFAVAASRFAPVRLVAVVGGDFQDRHLDVLAGRPIDLRGLSRLPGETFRWSGEYRYDMNEAVTRKTDLNVLERFRPQVPAEYRENDVVFLANIDPDLQSSVLDQVTRPKLVAADTMNFWIESRRDALERLLRRIDMLVINEGETRMLGGEVNIQRAARRVLEMGPKVLVVKRGEYGVLMFNGEDTFAAPGLPIETVTDPTGAGDTFSGGMMGWLARSGDYSDAGLRRAVVYGSVMASFTVEDFGLGRLKTVSDADVEARFGLFERLTRLQRL